MNDHDWIVKARRHLNEVMGRHAAEFEANHGLTAGMFTEATVSDGPVVSFRCVDREDVMEIHLDPRSGDLTDLFHIPEPPKK